MARIKNINCKNNCETGWQISFINRENAPNVWSFRCIGCSESFKITLGDRK